MKISKWVLPIVCLCTLSSCGSSVSEEEFMETINDVINSKYHKYKKAIVEMIQEQNSKKIEAKCEFTLKDSGYIADSENKYAETMRFYMNAKPNSVLIDESTLDYFSKMSLHYDKNAKIDYDIKYYVNPFKVVASLSSKYNSEKFTGETKVNYLYKFNKYGCLTFMEETATETINTNATYYKTSATSKTHTKISVSYKD